MATINFTNSSLIFGSEIVTWSNMAVGDSGQGTGSPGSGDRTVQVQGTFGASGTVIIEGTIDNLNWYSLRDPSGSLLSFTSAGLKAIMENVLAIRPRVTAGDGTTAIQVMLLTRSPRNG